MNYKRQRKKRNSKSLNKLRLQRLDKLNEQRLDKLNEQKMYDRKRKVQYFTYLVSLLLISLTLIWIYFLTF